MAVSVSIGLCQIGAVSKRCLHIQLVLRFSIMDVFEDIFPSIFQRWY